MAPSRLGSIGGRGESGSRACRVPGLCRTPRWVASGHTRGLHSPLPSLGHSCQEAPGTGRCLPAATPWSQRPRKPIHSPSCRIPRRGWLCQQRWGPQPLASPPLGRVRGLPVGTLRRLSLHLPGGETEAQRWEGTCSWSHRKLMLEPRSLQCAPGPFRWPFPLPAIVLPPRHPFPASFDFSSSSAQTSPISVWSCTPSSPPQLAQPSFLSSLYFLVCSTLASHCGIYGLVFFIACLPLPGAQLQGARSFA